ncbi:hypothetical protein CORC01_10811 [Colletotrichum orchidophilum]|uniref:Uncharacterized protein n=1 Tax=Colletotrichum orchidophilum TaxID=1209926 RepID=A0A1G4AXY9_9PEZI|nr:uncharacterized protein CORC01_10811 [Colletotrichum orchidophilum]OHE93912.1 hypothetical protein CORC01_10811 [Colletotrichum orchidophilum]
MCEWYRAKFTCGHGFTGASEWCYLYSSTQKRCKVNVTQDDDRPKLCGSCIEELNKKAVPWEFMIKRPKAGTIRQINSKERYR